MQLPTNWGRWQEQNHQSGPEYGMMGHSSMMQYDSRATSSPTVQQPSVATQYMVGNSYSMPSVSSMTAPHYQPHNPFGFQAYPPSTPSPLVAPFRQFSDGRPTLRVMPISSNEKTSENSYSRDGVHSNMEANNASPEVKHELHTPSQPAKGPDPSAVLTPTSAKNEGVKFENNTFIDNLMRVVQSKLNNKPEENSPEGRYPSPPRGSRSASPEDVKPNEKQRKYRCDVPNCNQRFAQKTHLFIHIRRHTGEKPYPCNHPGCGHYFSQLGNLKTHERRHTGEKPYACEQCGKRFAQRGNVRAHMNVHDPSKRFYCNLDGCGRPFTQRGNLKSHQNKFHTKTLMELTEKFATMSAADLNSLPKEERRVFDEFAITYKNLNKGIKGRGRDRTVAPAIPRSQPHNGPSLPGPSSNHHLAQQQHTPPMHPHMTSSSVPQLPQLPHPAELQHPHHQHGHPAPAHHHHHEGDYHSYVMMRQHQHHQQQHNNPGQQHHMMVGRTPRTYEMIDVDQESLSGSGATPSSTGTFYEEDHNRNLSFSEHRMY